MDFLDETLRGVSFTALSVYLGIIQPSKVITQHHGPDVLSDPNTLQERVFLLQYLISHNFTHKSSDILAK